MEICRNIENQKKSLQSHQNVFYKNSRNGHSIYIWMAYLLSNILYSCS